MASKPTLNDLMYEYYFGLEGTPVTAAGAPTSPVATAGAGFVSVAFVAPASTGSESILGYEVTLSNGRVASGTSSPIVVPTPGGSAVTATVKAFNGALGVASAASNSVTPTVFATVPAAPTVGTLTPGQAQVSLAFTAPGSNGGSAVLDYRVTLSTGQIGSGSGSPIVVTGVTSGMLVNATVAARNLQGYGPESAVSNAVTATPEAAGPGGPGGEVPVYLGNIGTRCILPRQKLGTSRQFNSKAFHRVATAKPNPIFEFPGVMGANAVSTPTGDGDMGIGGPGMSIRASLEYPAGVFTRLTFSGSQDGFVTSGGFLRADPVAGLTIPARTGFYVWVFGDSTAGGGYPVVFSTGGSDNNYAILGESYEHAASGLTDKSDGTAFAVNPVGPGLVYRCTQILAQTTDRSFAVVGDSRQAAPRAQHDADGQNGTLARAISQARGVTVPSTTGDLAQVWDPITKVYARRLMLDNVTDVAVCIGRNDIYSGGSPASLATIQARFNIIAAVIASKNKRLIRATLMPDTTSTDNWTTATNQSTKAAEAVRVAYNNWLRNDANFPAGSYCVDLADMAEVNAAGVLTRNGGRWLPNKTYDGIHQTIEFDAELVPQVRAAIGI